MGPRDGECDDDEQGGDLVRVGNMGVLDIEATGLCVGEQAFDPPPLAIEVQAAHALTEIGGDDEQLGPLDAFCRDAQLVGWDRVHAVQPPLPRAAPGFAQQAAELAQTTVREADLHVLAQADGERDIVFTQEFQPPGTYELPVCQQRPDGRRSEKAQIALQQRDALRGVGIAGMRQQRPHQRDPEPARDDRQNQHVHIARSQFPVGPVKGQQLRTAAVQRPDDQPRGRVPVKAHELEKPLQATVIRSMLRVARKLARQMRKVHRAPVCEPNQQHSQRFKPGLAQAKMRT
jgi:hypothetical protein